MIEYIMGVFRVWKVLMRVGIIGNMILMRIKVWWNYGIYKVLEIYFYCLEKFKYRFKGGW